MTRWPPASSTPRASAASLVPEDLSVIGFDDTPIAAHIWPPLTTVRWPIVSMARSAALQAARRGRRRGQRRVRAEHVPSSLVRRASVARPRRA